MSYDQLKSELASSPKRWLVTGVAGFIGSNLLESLLRLGQTVVGLDNFSTGKRENLQHVRGRVQSEQWAKFTLIEGDVRSLETCHQACRGVDYLLHHAALASVPWSVNDPLACHEHNVTGFANLLVAGRDAQVKRTVYASSSAVYGNDPTFPKREEQHAQSLSPYALSKHANELYAEVFARCYRLETIGLRYFNIFGPRQDPNGAYAAVIPRWIAALLQGQPVEIYGDGETSRDFCYVENVVQANLLAATSRTTEAVNRVFNVGLGQRTTLNELFNLIRAKLCSAPGSPLPAPCSPSHEPPPHPSFGHPLPHRGRGQGEGAVQGFNARIRSGNSPREPRSSGRESAPSAVDKKSEPTHVGCYGVQGADLSEDSFPAPIYRDFRAGDVRHSVADITSAQKLLGYAPTHDLSQGLEAAFEWYRQDCESRKADC